LPFEAKCPGAWGKNMAHIPSYNGIGSIESFLEILFTDCKRSAVFPDYHKILKFYRFLGMISLPGTSFALFFQKGNRSFKACLDKRS
jgi:hypothetical protein